MNTLFVFYASLAVLIALLASVAIWAPRHAFVRFAAVGLVTAVLILGYGALTWTLGLPRPIAAQWYQSNVEQATVLGVSFNEGTAIYLWLREDDHLEPRYLVFPWKAALAQRLQKIVDEGIRKRGIVRIQNPYSERGFDDIEDLNLHLIIPPSPPLKLPQPPAQVFNPRSA